DERLVSPVELFAGSGDLFVPEGLAVNGFRPLLGGRAESDDGLAHDERRTAALRLRRPDGRRNGLRIMTVHAGDHMPVIALEAPRGVILEPSRNLAVDRDSVVVVKDDQLAEPECAGQRAGFVRNTFHQAT